MALKIPKTGAELPDEKEVSETEAHWKPTPPEVRKSLRDILRSKPFRSSKQCQDLLSYVVEHSLAGEGDLLRERVIGAEVFGRDPAYDAANDPVVRARISEVRKRLAQYYVSDGQGSSTLLIDIPSGSYVARFERRTFPVTASGVEAVEEHEQNAQGSAAHQSLPPLRERGLFRRRPFVLAAVFAILCGVSAFTWRSFGVSSERVLDQFWAPALKSPEPIILYTGTNVVYRFRPQFLEQYRQVHHLDNVGPEFVVDIDGLKTIRPSDLSASSKTYVSVGDVSACSAIISMLAIHGKAYQMRYADDISAGDVRSGSTVLIGAFNNSWTMDVTKSLRFAFVRGDTIEDRMNSHRAWSVKMKTDGTTLDDFAVVTRVLLPKEGGIMLTAAGIGQYGTQAASEFITSSQKLTDFSKQAPKGWPGKNVQIVLHVKVVDDVPGAVDVVATHFW